VPPNLCLQICSDKTGTLTQNRMTVVRGIASAIEFGQAVETLNKDISAGAKSLLFESVATNSTAYEGTTPKGLEFLGNKTECALLGFTKKLGSNFKVSLLFYFPDMSNSATSKQTNKQKKIQTIRDTLEMVELVPFSSARKSMATVVSISKGKMRSHVKGASEIVLGMCTHHLNLKGESVPLTDADKKKYEALIQNMAEGALRTICLAYRDASEGPLAFFLSS